MISQPALRSPWHSQTGPCVLRIELLRISIPACVLANTTQLLSNTALQLFPAVPRALVVALTTHMRTGYRRCFVQKVSGSNRHLCVPASLISMIIQTSLAVSIELEKLLISKT